MSPSLFPCSSCPQSLEPCHSFSEFCVDHKRRGLWKRILQGWERQVLPGLSLSALGEIVGQGPALTLTSATLEESRCALRETVLLPVLDASILGCSAAVRCWGSPRSTLVYGWLSTLVFLWRDDAESPCSAILLTSCFGAESV